MPIGAGRLPPASSDTRVPRALMAYLRSKHTARLRRAEKSPDVRACAHETPEQSCALIRSCERTSPVALQAQPTACSRRFWKRGHVLADASRQCAWAIDSNVDLGAAYIHGCDDSYNTVYRLASNLGVKVDQTAGGYSGYSRLMRRSGEGENSDRWNQRELSGSCV